MKRIGFAGVLALCLPFLGVGYFYLKRQVEIRSGCPIRLDPVTHDFGEVRWGDTLKYTLHFVNTSRREVMIERVDTGCGCTVAEWSSRRLRPGERGSLMVQFNPTGFTGQVESAIQLYLYSFQQPVTCHIRANVNPLFVPSPPIVDFEQVNPGRQANATVVLRNTSGQQVKVTHIHSSAPYIHARLLSEASANSRHPVITISLVNPPVGRLYEHLSIQTSLKERPQIDIPIQAEVLCKWASSDREFFFGFVNKGQRSSRKVVVNRLHPADVVRAWTDVPMASVHTAPRTSPPGIEVTVGIDLTKAQEGPFSGSVFIETKDKEQPLLCIPVVGSIQDPNRVAGCCS